MTKCVAIGCSSRTDKSKGVSFHKFPKNPAQKHEWVKAMCRENEIWKPSATSVLCSIHFDEKYVDLKHRRPTLKPGAVPTIFPAFSCQETLSTQQTPEPQQVLASETRVSETLQSQENKCGSLNTSTCGNSSLDQRQKKRIFAERGGSDLHEESPSTKKLRHQLMCKTKELSSIKKKVKVLQQSKRRLAKKVATLKDKIKSMKGRCTDDVPFGMLSGVSSTSQQLLRRQQQNASRSAMQKTYNPELRSFAITLNHLSTQAYNFVRKTFDTCLPHPKTISRWYKTENGNAGFSSEVIQVLKDRCSLHQGISALILDTMAIRQHMEWDGRRFQGVIDIGVHNDSDSAPLAKEALVFYLVFINAAWQVPVGYFLIDDATGPQLCTFVKQCLTVLHDANVRVVSLTCDGSASNISMADQLGCNISPENLKSDFPHPVNGEAVHFFLDPCRMMKLVRNTLGDKKCMIDENDEPIEWSYIERLNEVQNVETLHLGNKSTKSHVNNSWQKVKVNLAVQTFSNSVADSLVYCTEQKLEGFEGTSGTVRCLRLFSKLFDILNSRSISVKYDKCALNVKNISETKQFFTEAIHYIRNLKDCSRKPMLTTQRKTGFLGLLVCIQSTCMLYDTLVGDSSSGYPLKYLPVYKVSQDHLERLFCYIRSKVGHNDNPTCKQFSTAYRMLIRSELKEARNLNVSPNCKSPITAINQSLSRFRMVDIPEESVPDEHIPYGIFQMADHDYTSVNGYHCTTDITSDIVAYVAGHVARKLEREIHCEDCSSAFMSSTSCKYTLIEVKSSGGLRNPPEDINKICQFSEKVFRFNSRCQKLLPTDSKLMDACVTQVMKMCYNVNLFAHLNDHFIEHLLPNENHYLLLIEAIVREYFKIRFQHYTNKQLNSKLHMSEIRNYYTKLVQSRGQ